MTTAGQYREQHCTYHLILFAASASCAAEIYIGARIRGSFINIVAVISLSRLMRIPDPWIFKCQPGSAGSDNVLAPRNIICHPIAAHPSVAVAATSIVDSQEGRNTRQAFPGEGRSLHSRISLFRRGLTIQ